MKASKKLLFGAAGFSIGASALFMGVGVAVADGPDTICVTECGISPGTPGYPGLTNAIIKISESPSARKAGKGQQEFLIIKLTDILISNAQVSSD